MHASAGILFNHESPLRGQEFVTRKITLGLARMAMGEAGSLRLGNMDAKRDWGHARDYVDGMAQMTECETADEYVLATGVTTSVRDFVTLASAAVEMEIFWQGTGVDERGIDAKTGAVRVVMEAKFFRPAEVDLLLGDPSKAKAALGWMPETDVVALAAEMVAAYLARVKQGGAIG